MVGTGSHLRQWLAALRANWLTAAGLVAVAALIVAVRPAKLLRALEGADVSALLLMLPCVLLVYLFHGTAWWIELRRLGAGVGMRPVQQATFLSQAFVFLPGGDLWRVPILRRLVRPRLSNAALVGAVVFDDLVFLFVLSLGMIPAVLLTPALALPLALLMLPQVAVLGVLAWPAGYAFLARKVTGIRPLRRFEPTLRELGPSCRRLFNARTLAAVVAVDVVCAALTLALFTLAVSAVHANGTSLQRIAFTFTAGQVVAALTMVLAALGAFEGLLTGLLSVQGIAPAAAAAAALLYRAVNDVLMALVGLALALVFERPSSRSRSRSRVSAARVP